MWGIATTENLVIISLEVLENTKKGKQLSKLNVKSDFLGNQKISQEVVEDIKVRSGKGLWSRQMQKENVSLIPLAKLNGIYKTGRC